MALLFCDSVRHYSTFDRIVEKWTSIFGYPSVDPNNGRNNGACLRFSVSGGSTPFTSGVSKSFLSGVETMICGFRFKQIDGFSSSKRILFAFIDGSSEQVCVGIEPSGALQAYSGFFGAIGSPSVNQLSLNTLYYIEIKALINGSAGTLEVRVDGTSTGWLALTGIDTQATTNATCNGVKFGGTGATSGGYRYISDVYVCDTNGSYNNDFLGEVNIDAYFPDGAGNYSQWTPSAGSNYACVDEADPSVADYVSSATPGNIDTYTFADLTGINPQIKAVVNNLWARKSDSGTIYVKSKYRRSGVDYAGTSLAPNVDYDDIQHIYEVDPATSAVWTVANVNAAEFGAELSSS